MTILHILITSPDDHMTLVVPAPRLIGPSLGAGTETAGVQQADAGGGVCRGRADWLQPEAASREEDGHLRSGGDGYRKKGEVVPASAIAWSVGCRH